MTHRPFNKNLPYGVVNGQTTNNVRYTQGGVDYDVSHNACEEQTQGIEPFNPNVIVAKALGSAKIDNEAAIESEVQSRLASALKNAGLETPEPKSTNQEKSPKPKGTVLKSKTANVIPEKMDSSQLRAAVEFKHGVYTNRKAALKFLASE